MSWVISMVAKDRDVTYVRVQAGKRPVEVGMLLRCGETMGRYRVSSIGTTSRASTEAGFSAVQLEVMEENAPLREGMILELVDQDVNE